MHITAIYASLLALLVLVLTARVAARRRATRIGIGDGGDHELLKRIRVHANALEYVPLALILLLLAELGQTRAVFLHAFGASLVVGRILHALGLSKTSGVSFGRMAGTALTLLVIFGLAILLLWQAFVRGAY